jgi:hypothetical protein
VSFLSCNYTCRTHLDAGSRQHSVHCKDSPFDAVSQDTLTVAPHSVGGVRCTNLARSGTESCSVNTVQLNALYLHMAQDVTCGIGLSYVFGMK